MMSQGWWDEDKDAALFDKYRAEVLSELKVSEKIGAPALDELVTDVYNDVPKHLQQQLSDLKTHIAKYPDAYPSAKGESH